MVSLFGRVADPFPMPSSHQGGVSRRNIAMPSRDIFSRVL